MSAETQPSAETVYVEAAAWVVRLHGPDRSPALENGLRRWLAEKPEHRVAFELATETWGSTANVKHVEPGRLARWMQRRPRAGVTLAAAAGAAAVAIGLGLFTWFHAPQMQTQVGEQRTLLLDDGTKVSLNTDTQLVVHFDERVRRIILDRGEALFDVASDRSRPFIVKAGTRRIEALGTSFVVRKEDHRLAVTLVEGKVAVSSEAATTAQAEHGIVLAPGERVVFSDSKVAQRDQPSLEKLTAWQRGLVMLDETPLSDAIVEMNRYSDVKLDIEQTAVAGLQVSGIFRAGDSMRFARAVARTYGLTVVERPGRIVLAGAGVS